MEAYYISAPQTEGKEGKQNSTQEQNIIKKIHTVQPELCLRDHTSVFCVRTVL